MTNNERCTQYVSNDFRVQLLVSSSFTDLVIFDLAVNEIRRRRRVSFFRIRAYADRFAHGMATGRFARAAT